MKANPGGQIDPKAAIGRDALVAFCWETLQQQSLRITAERRIGKTTLIRKMLDEPLPGWVPVYQDLEGIETPFEFAQAVYREIDGFLTKRGKATRRVRDFFSALGGVEVQGFKLPDKAAASWKELLVHAVEDLVHEKPDTEPRLLFLWDELPYMLDKIRQSPAGERTAMEVLDFLRYLRQTYPSLRMVLTGSIGLHHVLTALRREGHANAAVNDLAQIKVEPLAEADAIHLAEELLTGEGLATPDGLTATARAICAEVDRFPFYVHHVVKALAMQPRLPATVARVAEVVLGQLTDDHDLWELGHYHTRLRQYYGAEEKIALIVLDELAAREPAHATVSVDELLQAVKNATAFDDRERLLDLLKLMGKDHYLQRGTDGRFQFCFPLIRRWWKLSRGL